MGRLAAAVLVALALAWSAVAEGTEVRGYYRKDGTYVRPHTRGQKVEPWIVGPVELDPPGRDASAPGPDAAAPLIAEAVPEKEKPSSASGCNGWSCVIAALALGFASRAWSSAKRSLRK